jgi:hypothetical protein
VSIIQKLKLMIAEIAQRMAKYRQKSIAVLDDNVSGFEIGFARAARCIGSWASTVVLRRNQGWPQIEHSEPTLNAGCAA